MGKSHSTPALRLQPGKSLKKQSSGIQIPVQKCLNVIAGDVTLNINVFGSLTCGWLLSEAIRLYQGSECIVALKTKDGLDILDEWLLRFEKSLKPFNDQEQLLVHFREEIPGLSINNFCLLKTIGVGENAKVVLCRKKDTGLLYAIKVLNKRESLKNSIDILHSERSILSQLSHPFIVKLFWAFQSESKYYFALTFCAGGELSFHLDKIGRFTENQAKFYFAEVLIALEYIHEKNIVYNNLKAENILLDIDGHIKLADFGLAFEILWDPTLTYTFGTTESVNPEVVKANNIKKGADFYSLGSWLYEMLTGSAVSCDKEGELNMPRYLSANVKSLIEGLMCKEATSRLGFIGVQQIKDHAWCEGINWSRVLKKRSVPPFRPNMKTSNFNPEVIAIPLDIEPLEIYETDNLDFATEQKEKSFWNTPENIMGEYNNVVFSERNSTDAEETFNSLYAARSLDVSVANPRSFENTESFILPAIDKEITIKSLSPSGKGTKLDSIKSLLHTVTGFPKYFLEDRRRIHTNLPLQIPNFSNDLGRMKECVRKKINVKKDV